jgi:hypothetical protein
MAMFCECEAIELKLNAKFLPPPSANTPPRDAVGKTRLNGLDLEVQHIVENAEQVDDTKLIDWSARQ